MSYGINASAVDARDDESASSSQRAYGGLTLQG